MQKRLRTVAVDTGYVMEHRPHSYWNTGHGTTWQTVWPTLDTCPYCAGTNPRCPLEADLEAMQRRLWMQPELLRVFGRRWMVRTLRDRSWPIDLIARYLDTGLNVVQRDLLTLRTS